MAKLKNTPIVLKVIYVLSIVSGIIGAVCLFLTVVGMLKSYHDYHITAIAAASGLVNYVFLGGLYYIVKAACLYVEKSETE